MGKFIKNIVRRLRFGMRHDLFFPRQKTMKRIVLNEGTLLRADKSDDASYTISGKEHNAYLQNETIRREVYVLDGEEYHVISVKGR